jgi:hypothetical protein
MKPFTLSLKSTFVFVSQLQQLDLNLPYDFQINGDQELRFDFQIELQYEHLQQHPELLKLFRERSDLYRVLTRPSIESTLIPLTKLVGSWEEGRTDTRKVFDGKVPYNPHNLEVFLEYFNK